MTSEHATTYSAESFRLLQREIDRLLSENNALRMAMGMLNQEAPEPDPLRPAVVRYLAAHDDYLNARQLRPNDDEPIEGDALWRARQALRLIVEGGPS